MLPDTAASAIFRRRSDNRRRRSESIHTDLIHQLPDQPQVSYQQFSGYVTVDVKKQKALFYYFVEVESNPASKPLVLWLNGGPGCSSLGVGAFSENGPFRPSGKALVRNEYSWNREANMLYLETPIGVGFFYLSDSSSYVAVNDKITATRAMDVLNFTPLNGKPIGIMYSHRDPGNRKSGIANIFIKGWC